MVCATLSSLKSWRVRPGGYAQRQHFGAPMSNGLLIVDDNAGIRSLIRTFVESQGYKVCGEAVDGVDAIERANQTYPDLILLDLSMPRMNGAKAASVLKGMMPNVPIILFTLYEFGDAIAGRRGALKVGRRNRTRATSKYTSWPEPRSEVLTRGGRETARYWVTSAAVFGWPGFLILN